MEIGPDVPAEELKARILIEKKTVLNLIDGFCVAVKHYLRGEEGTPHIPMSPLLVVST
jgi:ion channel-forming bestrophin family protein